jgi:hypothetical protein
MTMRNKKTGDLYQVIDTNAIGAGELLRGKKLAIYTRGGEIYIREQNDFDVKFEEVK